VNFALIGQNLIQTQFQSVVLDCGPFDATNVSKHLINQSEERILQI